jgi:hypothetical protein
VQEVHGNGSLEEGVWSIRRYQAEDDRAAANHAQLRVPDVVTAAFGQGQPKGREWVSAHGGDQFFRSHVQSLREICIENSVRGRYLLPRPDSTERILFLGWDSAVSIPLYIFAAVT